MQVRSEKVQVAALRAEVAEALGEGVEEFEAIFDGEAQPEASPEEDGSREEAEAAKISASQKATDALEPTPAPAAARSGPVADHHLGLAGAALLSRVPQRSATHKSHGAVVHRIAALEELVADRLATLDKEVGSVILLCSHQVWVNSFFPS